MKQVDLERTVYRLYRILDEIDTSGDIFKEDYEARSKYIDKHLQLINLPQDFIEELYDKYYIEKTYSEDTEDQQWL